MKPRILVVEDEPDAMDLIAFNLEAAGFKVLQAMDGTLAVRLAREKLPDLIVLDVMLPGTNGLEVCKILRRELSTSGIPILILTAKASEIDRVLGLELGADDYVTKPFSPRELVLRIKKLLGRSRSEGDNAEIIRIGELCIDVPKHQVTAGGRLIDLTATEFKLITLLAQRAGRVQSRERLLEDVWNYEAAMTTRTVDAHVRRLREKLGRAARFVDTVRGVGYRVVAK